MSFCEDNQEHLPLFLAGELDSELQSAMESHLADCQPCQSRLAFLKGFKKKVTEAEDAHSYPAEVHSRLTAVLEAEKAKTEKVVPLASAKSKRRVFAPRILSYVAAAAVICVGGLGLIQNRFVPTTPTAVASLVEHHDTCWHIESSPGRDAQFERWVEKLGEMPAKPTVSPELVAYDQRECPAGEVRAGHLMYQAGEQKVSVYILPAQDFMASYGEELNSHSHDGREVVLKKKGDWVYGVVAQMPREEIHRLVDTEHMAILQQYLAQREQGNA